jgi:NTP pyrophosphatase (non-canonical NTP hydrolase)
MEIDAYAAWAAETARIPDAGTRDPEWLSYLALGLTGEAGEVADHVKKLLRDGDNAWNSAEATDELGDILYYWAALCAACGHSPSAVLAASKAKIEVRIASRAMRAASSPVAP